MADIKLLDKSVWGKIAAGEVVEKPASIVKELVENSIDAKAKNITIEIKGGGTTLISILDDGIGIKKDQLKLAFLPHATSKLKDIDDLYNLQTMGFRGEALASICAVSKVELTTKTCDDDIGNKIVMQGGEEISLSEIACNTGTNIKVTNLFFNTPARAKFLRKNKTEENDITSYVEKLMLSHKDISFKYIVDDKMVYNTTNCSLLDIIYTIYGKDIAENMIEIDYKKDDYHIYGYISKPTHSKNNRTYQSLFVNNRYCINQLISASISRAYENFMMKGKFPVYILFLDLPTNCVDVNVHPNKLEVKFENSQHIYGLFNDAVFLALSKQTHIVEALDDEKYSSSGFTSFDETPIFNKVEKDEGISFSDEEQKQTENYSEKNNEIYESEINYNDNISNYAKTTTSNNQSSQIYTPKETYIFTDSNIQEKQKINESLQNEIKEQKEQVTYQKLFDSQKKVIGIAFKTYIIVEKDDNLYLIDQHAGHERFLFDKFMKQVENNDIMVQNLLVPYILNVNNKEQEYLENNLGLLRSYGFDIEYFGSNSYKISSIPMLIQNVNLKEYFDDVLGDMNTKVKKPNEIVRRMIATMACKAAVKAGNTLSNDEVDILLNMLKENNNTLLCPHGRPIVIVFERSQLEKMFKRIVSWKSLL